MMIHSNPYDSLYDPAMPVVEIQRLQARKVQTRWLRGFVGVRREVDLYAAVLQIGENRPVYVNAIASENADEVIVGRDILNQYVVTLDGPAGMVEVFV